MSFELKDVGGKTQFTLIHSGWGAPEEEMPGTGEKQAVVRDRMDNGWESIVLQELRKVVD